MERIEADTQQGGKLGAAFFLAFLPFGFRAEQSVAWAARCIAEGYHPDIYKRHGFQDEVIMTPIRSQDVRL
jgi:hypothetical protein